MESILFFFYSPLLWRGKVDGVSCIPRSGSVEPFAPASTSIAPAQRDTNG